MAVIVLSVTGAFLLRFDFSVPASIIPILKQATLIAILLKLPIFDWVGFYRGLRRFVSIPDLGLVFLGNFAGSMLLAVVSMFWIGPALPRSVLVIDAVLCFVGTALVRFSVRIRNEAFSWDRSGHGRTGILIYGAGAAGAELLREIHSNRFTRYDVKGFLDDSPLRQHALILGVPVLGTGRQAFSLVRRLNRLRPTVEEIIIAMPSATGPQMREALANCRSARIPCKTIPNVEELLNGKVLTKQVRNVSVQDLLGRQPVKLDEAPVHASIAGRSILITGAAGSIGSEICRQVARFGPACLVAFDQAESDLFRIENEIRERYPQLNLVTALGNIRDAERLAELMQQQAVESIFHAAAYKHVPMMETHICEAVRNNILGTWNLVRQARRHNVRSLLMISSDKAVNPICVMGATKRVCERIVSVQRPGSAETRCVSVRFGNVLGSNGSVVPIFQEQIAAGGPIKVTHPDVRRYFMTISEAVSLVVQASATSQGSEIFVLDMGEPIRIVDLAENMIRLAGMVPYEDIDIQFTGLRPGEKLTEEISTKSECMLATPHKKLHSIREEPLHWDLITTWIDELEELLAIRHEAGIAAHIQKLVPEYTPTVKPGRNQTLKTLRANGFHLPVFQLNGTKNGHGEKARDESDSLSRNSYPPVAQEH
ncbi:MAG TPA: nucleoside-diphosphate sugar epimerase/dehydratase [Candidatus Solibacter sp.]|nr:nucleoside-diphosphate sugar epimerase/dehydratase [Candidatus Solibacter sp.]